MTVVPSIDTARFLEEQCLGVVSERETLRPGHQLLGSFDRLELRSSWLEFPVEPVQRSDPYTCSDACASLSPSTVIMSASGGYSRASSLLTAT